jgi:uncharacterized protein YndB with AHSA1/START domain
VRIEQELLIARPPADVFAVLTDLERLPKWQKGTVEVRRAGSGPLTAGERLHEVHAAMGRRMASTFEVTEHEPPRVFALGAVEGPVPLDGRWELSPDDGGTRLRFAGSGPVSAWMKPLIAMQFRGHHRRLKRLLED